VRRTVEVRSPDTELRPSLGHSPLPARTSAMNVQDFKARRFGPAILVSRFASACGRGRAPSGLSLCRGAGVPRGLTSLTTTPPSRLRPHGWHGALTRRRVPGQAVWWPRGRTSIRSGLRIFINPVEQLSRSSSVRARSEEARAFPHLVTSLPYQDGTSAPTSVQRDLTPPAGKLWLGRISADSAVRAVALHMRSNMRNT